MFESGSLYTHSLRALKNPAAKIGSELSCKSKTIYSKRCDNVKSHGISQRRPWHINNAFFVPKYIFTQTHAHIHTFTHPPPPCACTHNLKEYINTPQKYSFCCPDLSERNKHITLPTSVYSQQFIIIVIHQKS